MLTLNLTAMGKALAEQGEVIYHNIVPPELTLNSLPKFITHHRL